jgi:ABC-2 type transport system permease protein
MDWKIFARSILVITEKNMRIYYFKGPVVVFGLLFPLIMFLTFLSGGTSTSCSSSRGSSA